MVAYLTIPQAVKRNLIGDMYTTDKLFKRNGECVSARMASGSLDMCAAVRSRGLREISILLRFAVAASQIKSLTDRAAEVEIHATLFAVFLGVCGEVNESRPGLE